MTIRRINHTGRAKIRREDVEIQIDEKGPRKSGFSAKIKLTDYSLADDANVYVEAYAPSICQRFSFGQIGNFHPPKNLTLSEFDSTENVKFRIKVVSTAGGNKHILAEADQLFSNRGEDGNGTRPLLPVDCSSDLGSEVFRLQGLNESDSPVLLINAAVGDWKSVSTNPMFIALAFPSIIRQVLCSIIMRDKHTDIDDTEDWRSLWLRFALAFPGVPELPDPENDQATEDWIELAVESFAQHHDLLSLFQSSWQGESL